VLTAGTQLVGYEQFRREPLFLEQLAHQPQRCAFVPPALAYNLTRVMNIIGSGRLIAAMRT
jgi:hypothetical protein